MLRWLHRTPPKIELDELRSPAAKPTIVFHLGPRTFEKLALNRNIATRIIKSTLAQNVTAVAISKSRAARDLAKSDNRFHIFFHGRTAQSRSLFMKLGYLPLHFYLDPDGFGPDASIRNALFNPSEIDDDQASAHFNWLVRNFVLSGASKHPQPNEPADDLPQDGIAVFLQIERDIVLRHRRITMAEMITQIIDERQGKPVLIKRHPKCHSPLIKEMLVEAGRKPGVHITNANVHSIIDASSHVACINSGTGFEALLHRKPVLSFGGSDYERATWPIRQTSDIRAALKQTAPPLADLEKFLFWFTREQLTSFQAGNIGAQILARVRATGYKI